MLHTSYKPRLLHRFRSIHRGVISLFIFGLVYLATDFLEVEAVVRWLFAWLGFCVCYLLLSWYTIYTMPIKAIIHMASQEDGSRVYVSLFILLATFACMSGIVFISIAAKSHAVSQALYVLVSVSSILLSWLLVHTLYVFHYAHLYYGGQQVGGLDFPGNGEPDYVDFAYFSIVMGCTFQVSDVEISAKKIRHVAMFHGLLSFALNTFVVALTINIVAGLIN